MRGKSVTPHSRHTSPLRSLPQRALIADEAHGLFKLAPSTQPPDLSMKKTILALLGLSQALSLHAALVVADNFEGGSFSADWDSTTTASITSGTGAQGTGNFATIPTASGPFGSTFDMGVESFSIDFYTNVQTSSNRQFNLQVSSTAINPSTGQATINLRYQGGWAAFNGGSWSSIAGLTSLTPGEWHRVRVSGTDWGTSSVSYDIEVSAAGANTFNSSVTGNTIFHGGSPTTQTAQSFNFNSAFGSNPGFLVDEVSVETAVVPEPTSVILSLLGSIALLSRRR